MNIKYMNQPKQVEMGSILKERLSQRFDEVWIVSGIAKDSAMEYLEDSIKTAVNHGTKVNVLIGVDRKNTSKDNLLKLIDSGARLSIHVNGENSKIETRIYVFENKTGDSYVYLTGGKFSEGGLTENTCVITEIRYSKDEQELFHEFKTQMNQGLAEFQSADREDITLLAMKGEIVSRIIDRKIPSINELYGNKEQVIGEQVYDEGTSLGIIKDEDFDDFEIEFDEGISVRKNVELNAEKEAKINAFEETNKTKEDLDRLLGVKNKEEQDTKRTRIVKDLTEADFAKMTTLIIEAGKQSAGEFKIQKGLAQLITPFINADKITSMTLHVLDNKSNHETTLEAQVVDTGKGISIKSENIDTLEIHEGDIIRILKMTDSEYRFEIIRETTEEFAVWERYLTNTIKGSKRRFGIL